LRYLLALARERRLKGAGALLNVNASTVSRRLEALEEAIGARLFDRLPSGLAPTAALEALLPHAEAVESSIEDFVRSVAGFEREPEGTVRITAPPGLAEHFVATWVRDLRERYPGLRIELEGRIGYADLTRREADIALRAFRPSQGDLVAVKIGDAEDTILGSKEYVEELGTLKRLDDARWIQWDRDLTHFSTARWLESQVHPDSIWLRTSHMGAQVEAAERGVGLMVAPHLYEGVHGLVRAKLSRALSHELLPFEKNQLWIVGHRALRHVPRIAVVWDFLLERVRALGTPPTA
jgi:DNA-binding transcriptional LysR family regulator